MIVKNTVVMNIVKDNKGHAHTMQLSYTKQNNKALELQKRVLSIFF